MAPEAVILDHYVGQYNNIHVICKLQVNFLILNLKLPRTTFSILVNHNWSPFTDVVDTVGIKHPSQLHLTKKQIAIRALDILEKYNFKTFKSYNHY